jgi:hypothetical protein
MKFYLFACAALLAAGSAFAQDEPAPPTTPLPDKRGVMEKFTTTLNIYSSQWLDAPDGITVRPVSPGYALYLNYKLPLYNPYVVLMLGPGVAFTDFRTNGYPVTPTYSNTTTGPDTTYFVQLQPSQYKRNKLSLVHIEVPVELKFSTRPKKEGGKAWFFAPGFVAGLLVNDYVKTTGEDDQGNAFKRKVYYTRNLSKYHYGASVRLGYGMFGLYGHYGLTPLFEDGPRPGMTFYKVGITLGGI